MLAALATVALALALPYAATAARAPGALAYFEFTREQCLDGQFVDALGGSAIPSMNRDLAYTSCPDSLGVTFLNTAGGDSRLTGYSTSAITNSWGSSSEVTWDMWMKADANTESFNEALIFGLLFSQCSAALKLEQTGDLAATSLALSNDACVVDLQSFSLQNVTHIAVVKVNGQNKMRVYVNGEFLYSTTDTVDMEDWKLGVPVLSFGYCLSCNQAWKGTMYSFAWYPYALDDTEILDNYEHGLPRSDAVAYNLSVSINEDGWAVLPTDAQQLYSEAPVSELHEVTGMSFDFDDEPDNPNYDPNNMRTITITSLPENCQLYTGKTLQPINSVPFQLTSATGLSVRLRPTFNLASFSSSFEFHVTDATTLQQTYTHKVDFNVVPVNDPPVATATDGTFFSRVPACIPLDGTDVDNSLSQLTFTIHNQPLHGQLYACDNSGVPTTMINDIDTVLPNHFVGYVYEDSEIGGSDVLAQEHLTFSVSDAQLNSSNVATFTIFPRLVAQPTCELHNASYVPTSSAADDFTVNEGGLIAAGLTQKIRIFAADVSGTESALFFSLETYPVNGVIAIAGSPVPLGAAIAMSNSSDGRFELELEYVPTGSSFTSPSTTYYGDPLTDLDAVSFDFYVSVDDEAVRSLSATQALVIKNVNSAPVLTWEESALTVKPSSKNDIQYLNITGFDITDGDQDVDLVHVQVECDLNCNLYLTKEFPDTYDLCTTCPCYVSRLGLGGWMCNLNNKSPLSKYHFVATPSRAVEVLNTLRFSISTPDVVVAVRVTIFDGKYDGDGTDDKGCIWWEKVTHKYPGGDSTSTRTECFRSSVELNVVVQGLPSDTSTSGDGEDVDVSLIVYVIYGLLVWLVGTVLYFVYYVCSGLFKCCKASSKVVSTASPHGDPITRSNV